MDKAPQKVKKRQKQGTKSHEMYMKRLKENILRDNQVSTDNSTPSTSSSTDNFTLLHLLLGTTLCLLALILPQHPVIPMLMTLV